MVAKISTPLSLELPFLFSVEMADDLDCLVSLFQSLTMNALLAAGMTKAQAQKRVAKIEVEDVAYPGNLSDTIGLCFLRGQRPTDDDILLMVLDKYLPQIMGHNKLKAFFDTFCFFSDDSQTYQIGIGNSNWNEEEFLDAIQRIQSKKEGAILEAGLPSLPSRRSRPKSRL